MGVERNIYAGIIKALIYLKNMVIAAYSRESSLKNSAIS
jgi:hypothetical protein